jgi:SAM-dependent methyltransferase
VSAGGGYEEYALVAELYDHVGVYRDRPDVAFFVEAARASGGPVLELGCGTGRVLVPTARAGLEIVGLDLSPHMLAVCRERLAAEPEPVRARARLVQADMRSFDLRPGFALATLPFRPFQHLLTVADQLACLQNIRRHLARGGRVILDVFNPSLDALANPRLGEEQGDEPEFQTPDGRRAYRRMRMVASDRAAQVNQYELVCYITHPDGRQDRFVQAFPLRYLFRFEAEHLLARAGFALEQVYSKFDRSPYGSYYPGELIFVARRAGG